MNEFVRVVRTKLGPTGAVERWTHTFDSYMEEPGSTMEVVSDDVRHPTVEIQVRIDDDEFVAISDGRAEAILLGLRWAMRETTEDPLETFTYMLNRKTKT